MFEFHRRAKARIGIPIPRIVPVQVGLPIVTVPVGVRHIVLGEEMIISVRNFGKSRLSKVRQSAS
ncbi:hypothetical protein KKA13_03460 [Patescibacteria group bacterium]|nr:hypothetical protein [Patescibacteria group bacterium]